jgi:glyoxylase-like metal-dependent hydrolase (beta-lactamase superfamily II)
MKTDKAKKKLSAWAKVLLVFVTVIVVLVSTAVFAYARYLHPTGKVLPGLYAVRQDRNNVPMGNFFIMQAGDKYIAFDAGYESNQTQTALQKLKISADDVIAVFITHSDYDHIGSLDLFSNAILYSWDAEFRYADCQVG